MQPQLRRVTSVLVCALGVISTLAADETNKTYVTPDAAAADPDFLLQGEYAADKVGVQVVAQGKGTFLVVVYRGGLPGAGWNGTEKQETDETAADVRELVKDLALKKVERTSPTLGAKLPPGAVQLFDGTEASLRHWQAGAKIDGGLLQQGCTSAGKFTDFALHIEFRLPYMPEARGQGRGNSGIYFQGRYETQMLDSFGLEGKDNECGGLYSIKAPDINACLPPLAWQTYDVEFTAARRNAEGKIASPARITVRHNGIVVHQDVELPAADAGAPGEFVETGPILLQDHGNPVRYRNIWVLPRSADQEAKRPIVPGFERFYASTGADPAEGGRLLFGELNCTACHQADEAAARHITARQSPVLDEVGKSVHPEYLLRFLADPHGTKPGTTMPDLVATLPPAERDKAVLSLVNLLASTGMVPQQASDVQAAQRGETLFRETGCLACHAPREPAKLSSKTSVPLGDLAQKYSVASLAAFLRDPHKSRPSGRMPNLIREDQEAADLATYLVGNVEFKPRNPNLRFAAYHGSWNNVPKYEELKPVKTGECAGFNLSVAGRGNDFGVRFEGFLSIEKEGDYTFHLGSDDGSVLTIDGRKVADSDGVHPHTVQSGSAKLKAGMHRLQVDYAQAAGEASLTLEFEGPGIPRQDANRVIFLTEKGKEPEPASDSAPGFRFDPTLVHQGRELFVSLGCANCHQLKLNGALLKSQLAKPLGQLKAGEGCLSASGSSRAVASAAGGAAAAAANAPEKGRIGWPQYDLNSNQRVALAAAISTPAPAAGPGPKELIARTMAAFNCYACHARDDIGGPERDRNPLFLTTIPEMGDEARVPPPLDGVGDKLTTEWLTHVLQNGAKDRPYMRTRMPRFGSSVAGALATAFVAVDRKTLATMAKLPEAEHRAKAVGRHLVGDKALGCVKCHTFGQYKMAGVQAIDLQTITRRVRDDWFLRYMLDPQAFRPGTRMPTGFANGQASVRDVYDGNPGEQLAAMWTFLKDGEKAGIPDGLIANVIELKPESRPIVYRNFLEGVSPRGIAVGFPERAHLAWDANRFCLTFVWHGRFIDAGKHWEGRGAGNQGPLGDHVMKLEEVSPLAVLDSPNAAWPAQLPRESGYRFRGYNLDADGRPHFRYAAPAFSVEDFPKPVANGTDDPAFQRRLIITAGGGAGAVDNLYFRAAAGKIDRQADGSYLIDDKVRMRLPGAKPIVRESQGRQELLVPVVFVNGKAEIVQEILW